MPSSCQLCRRYHTLALNHKTCRRTCTWPQEDRDSGRKTLSGKRGITGFDQGVIKVRFGRPNWDTVFPAAKEAHGGHPIGTAPNPQAPNPRFLIESSCEWEPCPASCKGVSRLSAGVFCCGPMGKALRAACVAHSELGGPKGDTIFKLHAEVF